MKPALSLYFSVRRPVSVGPHNLGVQLVVGLAVDLVVPNPVLPSREGVGGDADRQHLGIFIPYNCQPVEDDLPIHQQ